MKKLAFVSAAIALPLSGFSAVLFNQSPTDPDGFFSEAYSSNGSYFYGVTCADDFTLSSASTVQGITFYGSSENFDNADLTNFSAFQIQVLDTSFNVISNNTVSTSSLSATTTGAVNSGGGSEYALTFNTNLALGSGTYILNIGAVDVDPGSDGFIWSLSGSAAATTYFNGSSTGTSWDGWQTDIADPNQAFVINGVATPEPAPMVALGLGMVFVVRSRRRRR